jgi:hypothetical protein
MALPDNHRLVSHDATRQPQDRQASTCSLVLTTPSPSLVAWVTCVGTAGAGRHVCGSTVRRGCAQQPVETVVYRNGCRTDRWSRRTLLDFDGTEDVVQDLLGGSEIVVVGIGAGECRL